MALRTPAFNDAKTYGFEWLRTMMELELQEGVVGPTDFRVTAAAAGGLRVDVASGWALVKGDTGTPGTGLSHGLFLVVNDAAIANAVTVNAADASNPRLDQIILRVRDTADLGSTADDALLEVVTGTPTSGATLDNRSGAAALPNDAIRLADLLIPAGGTAVLAANVRDRRPWARGACVSIVRQANAAGANDYTTTSTSLVLIDATNLNPRVELSGKPVRLGFMGSKIGAMALGVALNGAGFPGATASFGSVWANTADEESAHVDHYAVPPLGAGSYRASIIWRSQSGASVSLYARSTDFPLSMFIREDVAASSANDPT